MADAESDSLLAQQPMAGIEPNRRLLLSREPARARPVIHLAPRCANPLRIGRFEDHRRSGWQQATVEANPATAANFGLTLPVVGLNSGLGTQLTTLPVAESVAQAPFAINVPSAPNGSTRRQLGAFYTPRSAADYMADWLVVLHG